MTRTSSQTTTTTAETKEEMAWKWSSSLGLRVCNRILFKLSYTLLTLSGGNSFSAFGEISTHTPGAVGSRKGVGGVSGALLKGTSSVDEDLGVHIPSIFLPTGQVSNRPPSGYRSSSLTSKPHWLSSKEMYVQAEVRGEFCSRVPQQVDLRTLGNRTWSFSVLLTS